MNKLILFLVLSCTLVAQSRIIVGKKADPPPPEKQAGDSVEIDPVTQDILVASNGMNFRLPPENLIQPVLTGEVARAGDAFAYTYSLANAAAARQSILLLTFECRYPEDVKLAAPTGWVARNVPPEVNYFRSLAFRLTGDDSQIAQALAPGKSAGPFRMTSSLNPGLVRAVVYAVPLAQPSTELSKGEKLRFLSPWAYQKVTELDTTDRILKYVLTVGPKIPPDHDSLSAIRMELAYASGQPEFAAVSAQLGALARSSTKEQLLTQLKPLAKDALQTSFVQALLWRLETVKE